MIEAAGEQPARERIGLARAPHRDHHLHALLPALDHLGNHLRRMLEVRIHEHHNIAHRGAQASGHRRFLAEIACEAQGLDRRIAATELDQRVEAGIAAAIVDKDEFPLHAGITIQNGGKAVMQGLQAGGLVIYGHHHRYEARQPSGKARHVIVAVFT